MSDIAQDGVTGEIKVTSNNLTLTSGLEATSQRLRRKLSMILGEWFLDTSQGLPYFTQIFVKNPNPVVVDAVFKRPVIEDPAVLQLRSFTLDLDTEIRVLTVTFNAMTTDGELDFSEPFTI